MDRVAWWATVHVVTRVRQDLETKTATRIYATSSFCGIHHIVWLRKTKKGGNF